MTAAATPSVATDETKVPADFGDYPRHVRDGWSWPRFLNFEWARFLTWILHSTVTRVKLHGIAGLPKWGPYLLLPNHTTSADPFLITAPIGRPCHYMASVAVLRLPVIGWWLRQLGAFAKIKYIKDKESMQITQRLWDAGQIITIFPEGRRSWDGQTQRIAPGIGRLIKRLDARVVYARAKNGYLFQPRWAKYPRYIPMEIEYDGPHHYGEGWSEEAIAAQVNAKLQVQHGIAPGQRAWGWRMAHGLPNLLWACPKCSALEGLQVDPKDGDRVRCGACGAGWRIDAATELHPDDGGPALSVGAAYHAQLERFGVPPRGPASAGLPAGVVLQSKHGRIARVPRGGKPFTVAEGAPTLTEQALELRGPDGAVRWQAALSDMETISIEVGNRVQLRIQGELFDLDPGGESILKWGHFLLGWRSPGHPVEVG